MNTFFSTQYIYLVLHLFAFSFWFGTVFYVTFVSGLIMRRNMNREELGNIQAKLFPAYFRTAVVCSLIMLLTYLIFHPLKLVMDFSSEFMVSMCLLAIFLLSVFQALFVGPWTTRTMFERIKADKDGDKVKEMECYSRFKKAHAISSSMNLVVIFGLLFHLSNLASNLHL